MSNFVQLGHGFGRVKLGTAHRGLGLRVDGFDSVLDVQKVDLDQPGLDKSRTEVCATGCCDVLHGEGRAPLAANLSATSLP